MRVVLDANVFVSALIQPKGLPGKIVKLLLEKNAFELISSSSLMEELKNCLFYKKVRKYIQISDEKLKTWITSLEIIAVMAEGEGPHDLRLKDPDDVIYLNAAYIGKASYIVTGDKHLLGLDLYEDIKIITPVQFLKTF